MNDAARQKNGSGSKTLDSEAVVQVMSRYFPEEQVRKILTPQSGDKGKKDVESAITKYFAENSPVYSSMKSLFDRSKDAAERTKKLQALNKKIMHVDDVAKRVDKMDFVVLRLKLSGSKSKDTYHLYTGGLVAPLETPGGKRKVSFWHISSFNSRGQMIFLPITSITEMAIVDQGQIANYEVFTVSFDVFKLALEEMRKVHEGMGQYAFDPSVFKEPEKNELTEVEKRLVQNAFREKNALDAYGRFGSLEVLSKTPEGDTVVVDVSEAKSPVEVCTILAGGGVDIRPEHLPVMASAAPVRTVPYHVADLDTIGLKMLSSIIKSFEHDPEKPTLLKLNHDNMQKVWENEHYEPARYKGDVNTEYKLDAYYPNCGGRIGKVVLIGAQNPAFLTDQHSLLVLPFDPEQFEKENKENVIAEMTRQPY